VAEVIAASDLDTGSIRAAAVTLHVDDVHVTYHAFEDRRPEIKEYIANGFRRPVAREIKAVRGVSLTLQEGEALGIIGPNGSGKSTLMQAMAGLLPPNAGEVYARSQPTLLGVGAALQPNVSGRRNILLGCLALGMTQDEVEAKMDDIIQFAGLEEFIDLPLKAYSSGMRARLHFSVATSVEPEILLIDEALSVGDEAFKGRSEERINELREKAGTVVLVSHQLGSIKETCDRAVLFEKGRITYEGEPDDVIGEYREHVKKSRSG
jgi:teichoic acid transport system ATP-binding protein